MFNGLITVYFAAYSNKTSLHLNSAELCKYCQILYTMNISMNKIENKLVLPKFTSGEVLGYSFRNFSIANP